MAAMTPDVFVANPELKELFAAAMDEVAEIVARDDGTVFGSEPMRIGAAFREAREMRKQRRKQRICSYPGCTKKAVRASHAIQRSGPLALISESGHVFTPHLSLSKKQVSMEKLGIGDASTFSCFCPVHELLFAEFEQHGELSDERHIALQVFRTVCRELVRLESEIISLERVLSSYNQAVNNYGVKHITEKLRASGKLPANFSLTNFSMKGGSRAQKTVEEALDHLRSMRTTLKNSYFDQALADATGEGDGLAHLAINVGQSIPVSLAGFGNFHVQAPSAKENVYAILNVWPMPTKTTITLAVPTISYHAVKLYINTYARKFLGLVTMIETWMINGTDHWFIRPSAWKEIPDARQQQILDDILDGRFSIGSPYPRSIFDDFRREAIKLAPTQNIDASEIEREQAKLI